jgi:simple sugar transport system permease protein
MNVVEALLAASVLAAVPLMLAAVGEAIGQRAGLLNLGVEGVMLLGGVAAFMVVNGSGLFWLGLLVGTLVGGLVGTVFGVLATRFAASQVILGLGVVLAGEGLSGFLFRERFGLNQPLLDSGMARPFRALDDLPLVGPVLFGQKWFVYAAILVVIAIDWYLRSSRAGLVLRAVGEAPFAAEAAGVHVATVRLRASILGQSLVGLGGASLAIVEVGFFSPGMTVGIGFIAIAVAMVGRQEPRRIALLVLAFGVLRGLGSVVQLTDLSIRPELLETLPYAGMIVLVAVLGRRAQLPRALGLAYDRESRGS